MKNFTISSLTFSVAGNATARNAFGLSVFVHRNLLGALALDKGSELTYPMFAVIDTVTINPYDEAGKPQLNADGTLVSVDRLQAMSLFLNKADIIQAHVDNAGLDLQITSAISAEATSLGLTEATINALSAMAI